PPERDEGTLEVHYPASNVWDGHGRPCDFVWRLQGDLDAAVLAARVEPVDVLALHEQLLGRRVVDIEKEFSGHVVHRGRMPPRGTDPGARVMFTMTGLLGDIGLEERWHLVAATPEILDQLESERIHQVGLEGRVVLRCARRPTLTRWVGLHGMFFGADHRRLLPPFFPVLRGQDTLMGWAARRCYPGDQFGFLPCALMHVPSPRKFDQGFEFL